MWMVCLGLPGGLWKLVPTSVSHPLRKFAGMNNQSTPTTKSMPKWLKIVLIVFGAFVALGVLIGILSPQSDNSSPSPDEVRADAEAALANGSTTSTSATATEAPPLEQTPTTTEPSEQVTAVDLYQEREANATRFTITVKEHGLPSPVRSVKSTMGMFG